MQKACLFFSRFGKERKDHHEEADQARNPTHEGPNLPPFAGNGMKNAQLKQQSKLVISCPFSIAWGSKGNPTVERPDVSSGLRGKIQNQRKDIFRSVYDAHARKTGISLFRQKKWVLLLCLSTTTMNLRSSATGPALLRIVMGNQPVLFKSITGWQPPSK
jgi:hypothetical protein